MLGTVLGRWGYDTHEASSGMEAWEQLEKAESPFDIAILDWNMPVLDGLEICGRLRERKRPPFIIMVTGKGADVDVIQGLNAGANDYLTKPFTPELLRLRLLIAAGFVEKQKALTERV